MRPFAHTRAHARTATLLEDFRTSFPTFFALFTQEQLDVWQRVRHTTHRQHIRQEPDPPTEARALIEDFHTSFHTFFHTFHTIEEGNGKIKAHQKRAPKEARELRKARFESIQMRVRRWRSWCFCGMATHADECRICRLRDRHESERLLQRGGLMDISSGLFTSWEPVVEKVRVFQGIELLG